MAYMPNYQPPPRARQTPPYFDPQTNDPSWNPFSDRDVFNYYQNIGRNQYQQSQDWSNEFSGLADYYRGNEAQAGQNVNDLYNPIWQGGGGYTPDQMNNVLQSQGLSDVQGDLPNNFLTGDEQTNILGDPTVAGRLWSGSADALMGTANNIGTNMRGEVAGGRDVANMNQGNWRTMAGGTLAQGARGGEQALSSMRSGYDQAIDPTALSVSAGYRPGLDAALSAGESRVSGAESDPGLNVTDEYLHQAGMSDQEVQDAASAAARDVGAQYDATKDELRQRAAASGTATPLGIAAAETQLNRQGSVDQADALTRARLNARQMQRDAATGIQGTQLNAGQYRAGLRSGNALALQNSRIAADTGAEQLRLGANSNLAGLRVGATRDLGAADLAQNQYLTSQGLGLARDLGTAENQNNQYFTGQGLSALDRGGQYSLGTASDIAHTGTNLAGTAENTIAGRMANVAQNRQGVNQANQQTNLGINSALAGRYQAGYQPWVNAQTEGRQAAQGQQQFQGNQANTQSGLRLGGWSTGNQGQATAANGYAGWGSSAGGQGFGDVFGDAFGRSLGTFLGNPIGSTGGHASSSGVGLGHGAHGGMIDHNQLIEVGEHDRPEVILPLDPMTPPNQRNRWERMGAQLGRSMGIHPKHYASGGVIGLDAPNPFTSHLHDLDSVSDDPYSEDGSGIRGYARGGPVGFGRGDQGVDPGSMATDIWDPRVRPDIRGPDPTAHDQQWAPAQFPTTSPLVGSVPGARPPWAPPEAGAPMPQGPGVPGPRVGAGPRGGPIEPGTFNPGVAMGFNPGPPIQGGAPPPQAAPMPAQGPSMQFAAQPGFTGYRPNMQPQPQQRQWQQPVPGVQPPSYGAPTQPPRPQPPQQTSYGQPPASPWASAQRSQQPQGFGGQQGGYGQQRQRRPQGFGGAGYQMGMYS